MSMREAIARFVEDGDSVVLGTFMEAKIPFSAGHEIIRQGKKDLTLVAPISDMLFDQLIGAGCAAEVRAAWVGNVMMGSAYNFRRACEQGKPRPIRVTDYTNFTMALALQAGAWGVPFLPTLSTFGTDLLKRNPSLKSFACPLTGKPLVAVEALRPDVAVLPVQRCDELGNSHSWGNWGITLEASRASRKVLLVTEEVVSTEVIRSDPNRSWLPGFLVAAVVHEPWGCHPSPVQGYYNRDHSAYQEYHRETKTEEGFAAWSKRWVHGVRDRAEYMEQLGADRARSLRVRQDAFAHPTNFGF